MVIEEDQFNLDEFSNHHRPSMPNYMDAEFTAE
jgi:hypothetical protein